jgi:hypothetical protein
MSWLDSIGEFVDGNASWIKPILNVGGSIYQQSQAQQGAQGSLDAQMQGEQQRYDNALAEQQAYNQYVDAINMHDWQNQNSRAAAQAQQDELSRRYAKKANRKQREHFGEAKGYLEPYRQTGLRLLPQMEGTYTQGLNNLGLLGKYAMNAKNMAALDGSKPAYEVQLPLPEYMRK